MGYDMNWREVPEDIATIAQNNRYAWDKLVAERDALLGDIPRWNHGPGAEDPAISEARQAIINSPEYQAKQKAVERFGWPEDPAYYRLNIWGMSTMRDVMDGLGVGYWAPAPDFPPFDPNWDGDETSPQYRAYEEAAEIVRAESPRPTVTNNLGLASSEVWDTPLVTRLSGDKELFGLPLHKFTSNDGWIVTPDDIREALKIYRSLKPAEVDSVLKHYTGQFSDGESVSVADVRKWFEHWMNWNEQAMLRGNGYEVW